MGLPPKIISKKFWGTVWSLNWLPIGGFCKLYGEDPSSLIKTKDSFMDKNPWQKGLIVLGGVFMNMVLAIAIFAVVYTVMGIPIETDKVKIIGIAKNSPAEMAGLKVDDVIISINNIQIKKGNELTEIVNKNRGKKITVGVQGIAPIQLLARENPPAGEGSLGVVISNIEMQPIRWWEFYKGIGAGFKEAYFWGKIIFDGVTKMVGGLFLGQVPKDVTGPIGMFNATSSIRLNQGFLAVIHFFGVVSVNLAVVNVLPFPALDGGRIIFVIYEMIFRKKANAKFETMVNNLGMVILLSMIVLISIGDVRRLF
ncbi:hypothetical protein COS53_03295 [Candidatus Shapirobacteria bacterium CG03_land_8_20_14_0_80_35_14]|uniref:PDZ domain-containing protein n=1 Tax=Candidatus Shapirobacteria bacterium CG03_land_8_20_14_0_80_35_14 TaxID=1974878 RepID=A0A2M7BNH7_9BACT|nr:MAG: hypothetical protein COS53_03295 [Candidatus Shapirobacteria bacterium CG03_land_8_20_14_0_80_35_14]